MNTSEVLLAGPADVTEVHECGAKNEGYDDARFSLVVYVGTPFALCGILFNSILIRMFSSRKRLRSPTFYLFLLAIFDTLICLIYVPFFTVDALAMYYHRIDLYHFWHSYVMTLYGVSRVVQFASTWMVVCATAERFVVAANLKSLSFMSTTSGRFTTVTASLLIVVVLRVPAFFDYRIIYDSGCPSFQDYTFIPVLMVYEEYATYNFFAIVMLHIILPFLLLLILNLLIILLTKKKIYRRFGLGHAFLEMPQISQLLRTANRVHKSELRYATITMVMITFTYLLCNAFNFVVTVMEHVFRDNALMVNPDGSSTKFYTYAADLVSIMVAVNSFLRIFVYFFCNPQFRFQLLDYFVMCGQRMRHCVFGLEPEKKKSVESIESDALDAANASNSKSADTCYL